MDNPVTIGLVMYVVGKVIGFLFGMLYKQRRTAQPYTEAEIQKMEELEQAQLQTAYEIGKQEAEPEQQWIPCSERLPEERGFYLTTTKDKAVYCDFWNEDNFDRTEMVIAWMPLPRPYKGKEE